MRAYDKAKADGVQNPCQHVASLRLRGFFRCCMCRWKRARQEDQWGLLCDASPRLAKTYREVPNVLREIMGRKLKFGHRSSATEEGSAAILPVDFERAISDCVVAWDDPNAYFFGGVGGR